MTNRPGRGWARRLLAGILILGLLCGLTIQQLFAFSPLEVQAAPVNRPLYACPDPTISQWTFTGNQTSPSTGTGTFSNGSGLTGPTYPGGQIAAEDPAISFSGWDSPTLGTNDYLELQVNLTDRLNISLELDSNVSPDGPTTLEIRYSTNGSSGPFQTFGSPTTLSNDGNWHPLNFDLSSISGLDNTPNVVIRLYAYAAAASGGTWSIDNVTVYGGCYTSLMVVISEVAWAGTQAYTGDEWIELYNPGSQDIALDGWILKNDANTIEINLSGTIPAGDFFLLERGDPNVTSAPHNMIYYSSQLSDTGATLHLLAPNRIDIDTANYDSGSWPAGGGTNAASMERIITGGVVRPDQPSSTFAWITNDGTIRNGVDAAGGNIYGTPGQANWAFSVTPTHTLTPTDTPVQYPEMTVMINEVAWMGTTANTSDEWIELYNPGTVPINLSGWRLYDNGDINIALSGEIQPGDYFLLERDEPATNIDADQLYTGNLLNGGETLYLDAPGPITVDAANSNGGYWPAGENSGNYPTMERYEGASDLSNSDTAWTDYKGNPNTDPNAAYARNGSVIYGTPGRENYSYTVPTPTPTLTRTPTPTRKPTALPTAAPRLVINEFLPRPNADWNGDGAVNVYDEFIEIKNVGGYAVDLRGWKLDDEANSGSNTYTLPSVQLNPGERIAYFQEDTGISLSDGGDTVRLLNSRSQVQDAYTYTVVERANRSTCRLPDGSIDWHKECFPTPGEVNSLEGRLPTAGNREGTFEIVCLLPDTLPEPFLEGECRAGGLGIWRSDYWDEQPQEHWFPGDLYKWLWFMY
ncbi:MAG: lamin tail domain-containing protein [Anaerolineales bacterium]|nr:lamin tail domain-containing protein [Anaerolineales bacterium]